MKYNLRPMTKADLDMVLLWRNRPEIRKCMFNEQEISKDEHYAWFGKVLSDSTKKYFIFLCDEEPTGVVGFMDIDNKNKLAFWGFYIGKTDVRGLGTPMGLLAINYAFENFGIEKICAEVLADNEGSLRYHKKLGFKDEGEFKEQILRNGKRISVFRFGMMKREWLTHKESLVVK